MALVRGLAAALRGSAVAALTVGIWILWMASALFGRRAAGHLRPPLMRTWGRGCLWLFGGRLEVTGTPPARPFLLISNHLSYMDVLVIAAAAPARFLSRADVANWPGIGPIARSAGTLFIDRATKRDLPRVIGQVQAAFETGSGVVFFPEGTSSGGAEVLPFKASLFEFAAQGGIPVHCASLAYERPLHRAPAAESVCWWREMTFGDHAFGLLLRPGFTARLAFAKEPVTADERKQLAARTEAVVRELFVATDGNRSIEQASA